MTFTIVSSMPAIISIDYTLLFWWYRPEPQGECDAKCRITYCHTCYYADEYRPLPGDCDSCPYYPEVRQAVNKCFKRWAVCTHRANANQYTKVSCTSE